MNKQIMVFYANETECKFKISNWMRWINSNTVKAFVITPHEMWEILVINIFEIIFID